MPTKVPPSLRLGVIAPTDAVRAFDERKLLLPSFRWQDTWQHEHQCGYAVAGVGREDVLKVFRDGLDSKFGESGRLADFKRQVVPQLITKGFWGDVEVTDPATGESRITRFDDRRLELIYDVNVRQSHAAGKWERYQATKAQFPFVLYRTMEDAQVRPAHAAWDDLVLPIDDPFWETHWPPNGWRCRCRTIQLNQRGIDRLLAAGRKLKRTAPAVDWVPYINPYTDEIKAVPRGIDPGFGYNPGIRNAGRDAALSETVLQKAMRSDAYSAAVMAAQAATDMPAILQRQSDRFAMWIGDVMARQAAGTEATGQAFTVGAVPAGVVRTLDTLGTPLRSAMVTALDTAIVEMGAHVDGAAAVGLVGRLPLLMANPTAVLRLRHTGTLVFVMDLADGALPRMYAVVVPEAAGATAARNVLVYANRLAPRSIDDAANYDLVFGSYP